MTLRQNVIPDLGITDVQYKVVIKAGPPFIDQQIVFVGETVPTKVPRGLVDKKYTKSCTHTLEK
jgi:hypothetical protein